MHNDTYLTIHRKQHEIFDSQRFCKNLNTFRIDRQLTPYFIMLKNGQTCFKVCLAIFQHYNIKG